MRYLANSKQYDFSLVLRWFESAPPLPVFAVPSLALSRQRDVLSSDLRIGQALQSRLTEKGRAADGIGTALFVHTRQELGPPISRYATALLVNDLSLQLQAFHLHYLSIIHF
jgi:hypothetical protein